MLPVFLVADLLAGLARFPDVVTHCFLVSRDA
jgi:hypothetical protein